MLSPEPDQHLVTQVMSNLEKKGFNVSILFTGPINDALAKAAKLKTGGKGKPGSLKESEKVVKKGDKPGDTKKNKGRDKDTDNVDGKWSDGDKGEKGGAFHNPRKTSKQV